MNDPRLMLYDKTQHASNARRRVVCTTRVIDVSLGGGCDFCSKMITTSTKFGKALGIHRLTRNEQSVYPES